MSCKLTHGKHRFKFVGRGSSIYVEYMIFNCRRCAAQIFMQPEIWYEVVVQKSEAIKDQVSQEILDSLDFWP